MKTKKIILIVAVALALVFSLSACSMLQSVMGNVATTTNNGGSSSNADTDTVTSVQVIIHDAEGFTATDFVDNTTMKTKLPSTDPTREGYTFLGWYKDEACTTTFKAGVKITTSSLNVYAKWEVTTFDVKLVDEKNGEQVLTYEYGEKLNVSNPTAAGYDFAGWYTDKARTQAYNVNSEIKSELILYAKWTYVQYSITFELNGGRFQSGTIVPTTYDESTTVTLPSPVKNGFDFIGWYENEGLTGEKVTELDGATGNKTFYAKYLSLFAEMQAKDGFSEDSQEEGVDFVFYTDYTEHEVDLTVYFTFSDHAEEEVTDITDENDPILLDEVEIAFTENTGTGGIRVFLYQVRVVSQSGLRENVYTVKACQYDENTVSVTYVVGGEIKFVQNVAIASILEEEGYVAPDKTGYDFVYWTEDGENEYIFGSALSENVTLIAKYDLVEYTIEYSLGKGTNAVSNPATYTVEDTIVFADATAPDGYTFVGWFDDETYANAVTDLDNETGDVTLYAQYTKLAKWSFTYENDEYTVTMAQYPYLLDYLLFSRVDAATVINVTDKPADFMTQYADEDFTVPYDSSIHTEYFTKASTPAGEVGITYRLSLSAEGSKVTVTPRYDVTFEPTDTSDQGTYEQINFVDFQKKVGRENGFTDFAVNHVAATMTVSDSEQLFFALENGYRPVCVSNSRAEEIYEEMLDILSSIVNDNMTDIQKVTAISEYLVKEIQYDNYVYELYMNGADTSAYRCFHLEGAIMDKVAVCDGISKAFACLCRIEGIEAIQVDGTHKGTNHAWNKVKIDLDGNGTREWTVVDCTSANLLLTLERDEQTNEVINAVEVMDHAFIFTSDEMLINQEEYVYSEKWDGVYEANDVYYNIYQYITLGEEENQVSLYVETAEELEDVFRFYIETIYPNVDAEDKPISLSFCVKNSVLNSVGNIGQVMYDAGFTISQINGQKVKIAQFEAQYSDETIFYFYLDETEAE